MTTTWQVAQTFSGYFSMLPKMLSPNVYDVITVIMWNKTMIQCI